MLLASAWTCNGSMSDISNLGVQPDVSWGVDTMDVAAFLLARIWCENECEHIPESSGNAEVRRDGAECLLAVKS